MQTTSKTYSEAFCQYQALHAWKHFCILSAFGHYTVLGSVIPDPDECGSLLAQQESVPLWSLTWGQFLVVETQRTGARWGSGSELALKLTL